jgi:hypothetical protein
MMKIETKKFKYDGSGEVVKGKIHYNYNKKPFKYQRRCSICNQMFITNNHKNTICKHCLNDL